MHRMMKYRNCLRINRYSVLGNNAVHIFQDYLAVGDAYIEKVSSFQGVLIRGVPPTIYNIFTNGSPHSRGIYTWKRCFHFRVS